MKEITTPLKAIRAKCIVCNQGQAREVSKCTRHECPLYLFRMGKNPYRSRAYTPEQKEKARERMERARRAGNGGNAEAN